MLAHRRAIVFVIWCELINFEQCHVKLTSRKKFQSQQWFVHSQWSDICGDHQRPWSCWDKRRHHRRNHMQRTGCWASRQYLRKSTSSGNTSSRPIGKRYQLHGTGQNTQNRQNFGQAFISWNWHRAWWPICRGDDRHQILICQLLVGVVSVLMPSQACMRLIGNIPLKRSCFYSTGELWRFNKLTANLMSTNTMTVPVKFPITMTIRLSMNLSETWL